MAPSERSEAAGGPVEHLVAARTTTAQADDDFRLAVAVKISDRRKAGAIGGVVL